MEKSTSSHLTLSSSVTQRSVMLNVSHLLTSGDKGFVLLTLSSLKGDEIDHTPLLISVSQLLVELGTMGTSPPVQTSSVLPTPSSSTICPSPTPAVQQTAFITLTVTSQCPEQSTPSTPATTSQRVQTPPRPTEVPTSGITIDQLMITRMTFVAIVIAIVLCVLVVILLVGCGVCFLCMRRKSSHEQKNVSLVTSRSTFESTI